MISSFSARRACTACGVVLLERLTVVVGAVVSDLGRLGGMGAFGTSDDDVDVSADMLDPVAAPGIDVAASGIDVAASTDDGIDDDGTGKDEAKTVGV